MTQRLLSNRESILKDRAITATNVIASDAIERVSVSRAGGGRVALVGPYSGQQNVDIDIEVLNNTISGVPSISAPVYQGVGNQTISALQAEAGTAAQVITVTLQDLGTPTLSAFADLQGVRVVAADPGADGNQITISVSQAGIARTPANFSTPDSMAENTRGKRGDEWNFGHEVLLGNGQVPATAPRIAFGSDPTIYRAYKVFEDGQYTYNFSPAIRRAVAADVPVFTVTGARTVTITDGTTTEAFTDIITRFDFLSALAGSTLVDVDGVVANDRLVDGAGTMDLDFFTAAYALSIVGDGSSFVENAIIDLGVAATAPTELLSLVLTDASNTGGERWDLRGAVSGALGTVTTGVPFVLGSYNGTIPIQTPVGTTPGGEINVEQRLLPRGAEDVFPGLCFRGLRLGARASNKEFTFTWTRRPAGECDCTNEPILGGPDADCLGLDQVEAIMDSGTLSNESLSRLESLSEWLQTAIRNNTETSRPSWFSGSSQNTTVNLAASDPLDIVLLERSAAALANALIRADATLDFPVFSASSAVSKGEVIQGGGFRHIATNDGNTASAEPTWNTTEGQTTTAGDVIFRNVGPVASTVWDAEFEKLKQDLAALAGVKPPNVGLNISTWQPNFNFATGNIRPTTANGFFFGRVNFDATQTTGGTEPSWPTTAGDTVTDGDVTWVALQPWWEPLASYDAGHLLLPGNESVYVAVNSGTSGSSIPAFDGGPSFADGDISWQLAEIFPGITDAQVVNDLVKRYEAGARNVLAAAGISPFEGASSQGGTVCWRDITDATHYWRSEDGLLPLFNGVYYHSARLVPDDDGLEQITSTQEFGLGLAVGCEENLREGDKFVVKLTNITNSLRTYQEGDTISAQIIAASPLQLGGGQDGDDVQTWAVAGSVDGALADYALDTTSPSAYADGGVSFLIDPGTLQAAAGDRFRFSIEGGQFRWRVVGGSWSSATGIATTVELVDGLTAVFETGDAPSFVAADSYRFAVTAANGASNINRPNGLALRTGDATVISLGGGAAQAVALFGHELPAGSTVTLQGSDDDFATATSYPIPIDRDSTFVQFASAPVTFAAWRLVTDAAITLPYCWLGTPHKLSAVNGHDDDHASATTLQPVIERIGSSYIGRGAGATADMEWLTTADVDWISDMLRDVAIADAGRFAWTPDVAGNRAFMVTGELSEVTDAVSMFKAVIPGVSEHELQRLQLTMRPVLF